MLGFRVVYDEMQAAFDILYVRSLEFRKAAAHSYKYNVARKLALYTHGFFELESKIEIVHGLYHEIERIHLIAADRILCHVRHEYERRVLVRRPKLSRGLYPVEPGHLDVHEHYVIAAVAVIPHYELQAVVEHVHLEFHIIFRRIPLEIPLEQFRIFPIILDYRNR